MESFFISSDSPVMAASETWTPEACTIMPSIGMSMPVLILQMSPTFMSLKLISCSVLDLFTVSY